MTGTVSASRPARLLKTQHLSLLLKLAATSTYSDENPFLDCDELEEDEAVIDDDQYTHQIELASYFSYLHTSQNHSQFLQSFSFADNGNRGLCGVL